MSPLIVSVKMVAWAGKVVLYEVVDSVLDEVDEITVVVLGIDPLADIDELLVPGRELELADVDDGIELELFAVDDRSELELDNVDGRIELELVDVDDSTEL